MLIAVATRSISELCFQININNQWTIQNIHAGLPGSKKARLKTNNLLKETEMSNSMVVDLHE
jgi:hypothetical protein